VVLEVPADTWKIDQWFNPSTAEPLRVTDSRTLKNERRAHCSSRNNYLLSSTVNLSRRFTLSNPLSRNSHDANSSPIFNQDFVNFGVAFEM
jgi:hypothetical protein